MITGNEIIFHDTLLLATTDGSSSSSGIALAPARDLYYFYTNSCSLIQESSIDPILVDEENDFLSLASALSSCTLL